MDSVPILETRTLGKIYGEGDTRVVAAEGKLEAMPGYDINLATGELNGKVARILVREGEAVAAGQLVAVLESDDLRAQVAAAQRERAVAQSVTCSKNFASANAAKIPASVARVTAETPCGRRERSRQGGSPATR
ncbi:MAG: biotin/lipoyl-binding protein [Betaproteobacteria bacterium]|nr:biotin/lipoyl-binding protein [Betaproteobacteria bacterium]